MECLSSWCVFCFVFIGEFPQTEERRIITHLCNHKSLTLKKSFFAHSCQPDKLWTITATHKDEMKRVRFHLFIFIGYHAIILHFTRLGCVRFTSSAAFLQSILESKFDTEKENTGDHFQNMTYNKTSKLKRAKTLKRQCFWPFFSRYIMVLMTSGGALLSLLLRQSWWGRLPLLLSRWFLTFISFNLGLEEIEICRLTCFIISKYNKSNLEFLFL